MKLKKIIALSLCSFGLLSCAEIKNLSAELSKFSSNTNSFRSEPKTLDDFKAMPLYELAELVSGNGYIHEALRYKGGYQHSSGGTQYERNLRKLVSLLIDKYGERADNIYYFTSQTFQHLSSLIGNDVNKLKVKCNVYGFSSSCDTVGDILNFSRYCYENVNEGLFNKMALQYGRANAHKLEQAKSELKSACAAFSDQNSSVYNAKLFIESYEKFLSR